MLPKYFEFLSEQLIENINESFLYFSPDLRAKLGRVKSEIATDLLSMELEDIKDDITFLDVDTDGYISFTTMKNAVRILSETYPDIKTLDTKVDLRLADNIWTADIKGGFSQKTNIYINSRSRIKLGRLVNKLMPSKFNPAQIEDFTNKFKSILERSGEIIELVSESDIESWYNSSNYKSITNGSLGNSCMKKASGIFDIYVKNPQVCRMIIICEDYKLVARSIVWKVDSNDFEYFMDRQYTINDSYVDKMRDYAIDKGWAYKTNNTHRSLSKVTYVKNKQIIEGDYNLQVQLNPFSSKDGVLDYDYKKYPYLDTFRRYDINTGILYNDSSEKFKNCYILESTDGRFREIGGVWSEYEQCFVQENEAIFSELYNTHLHRNMSFRVTRGSDEYIGVYPEDANECKYDSYYGDYIHERDAVYSRPYDTYILKSDAVNTIYRIDDDGSIDISYDNYMYKTDDDIYELSLMVESTWYKFLSNKFEYWQIGNRFTHIRSSLICGYKSFDDQYILKKFMIITYKVINADYSLTSVDSYILGESIESTRIYTDRFNYNKLISNRYDEILKKARQKQDSEYTNEVAERVNEIESSEYI